MYWLVIAYIFQKIIINQVYGQHQLVMKNSQGIIGANQK